MRPARICLGCGGVTRNPGGRCRSCQQDHDRARWQQRRDYYDNEHRTRSRDARQQEPWCHHPDCPDPHTSDLTWDHQFQRVECRSCNSSHRRNA